MNPSTETIMKEAGETIRFQMNRFYEIRKLFNVPLGPTYHSVMEQRQRRAVLDLIEATVHLTCHIRYTKKFTWGDFFTRFTTKFFAQFSHTATSIEISIREALLKHSVGTAFEHSLDKPLDIYKIRDIVKATQCYCGHQAIDFLFLRWYLVSKEMMTQLNLEKESSVRMFVDHMYMFLFETFRTVTKVPVRKTMKAVTNKDVDKPSDPSKFLRRKGTTTKSEINEDFNKYALCVQEILRAYPEVMSFIGKSSLTLLEITVEAIEESDQNMTWYKIIEQVCYVAISYAGGRRIVARGNAPETDIQLGIVNSKKCLAEISDPKLKWLAILQALGKLQKLPTLEKTVTEFYGSVVRNISRFLKQSAERRKQKEEIAAKKWEAMQKEMEAMQKELEAKKKSDAEKKKPKIGEKVRFNFTYEDIYGKNA